ncbi:MAG: 4a-hydroxytetrahydrobiopterin dehydratase [Bacteroidota bacterium]|nr:4a-hydroxytetrahydrobiopterin dehydratase [Bacteroidota bacterium]
MWKKEEDHLEVTLKFRDFGEAWAFMTEVAMIAEKMNHHPDWSNSYNTVKLSLCSHSEGHTVTEKDYKLADEIERIYKKFIHES